MALMTKNGMDINVVLSTTVFMFSPKCNTSSALYQFYLHIAIEICVELGL
jgi:hypothetical protein